MNAKLEEAQGRAIEAERRAHRDALTGLPNRYPLLEHIERTIGQARRTGSRTAVVFLDIDRFRVVNDSIGHSIGDALLLAVAERLARAMRSSDMLGRLGGDEFVVVASDASEPGDARRVGRRLLDTLSEPFRIEGTEFLVNPSIGVSLFPTDGNDADTLLRNANLAMCYARAAGGDRVEVFDPDRHVESMGLLGLEASLRKASIATEFVLHYQPIVELPSRAVVGFEALLRWRHPERGLLLPAEFLEVAETSGVLARLTPWILREACLEASRWPGSEDSSFSVSLNLSARQFLDADLAEHVEAALRRSSLPGRSLVLEISERLAMQHVSLMRRSLDLLKGLGVRIAIDDFGTGYSSLASLRALPIDILKIDRSFVHGLGLSDADEEITETILAMSRALRLVSVAEGVETNAQLEILIAHGCRRAQGYLFGPPTAAGWSGEVPRGHLPAVTPVRRGRRRTGPGLHDDRLLRHDPREDGREHVDVLSLLGLELAVELPLVRAGRELPAGVEEEGAGALLEVDGEAQERGAGVVLHVGPGEDRDLGRGEGLGQRPPREPGRGSGGRGSPGAPSPSPTAAPKRCARSGSFASISFAPRA